MFLQFEVGYSERAYQLGAGHVEISDVMRVVEKAHAVDVAVRHPYVVVVAYHDVMIVM